MKLKSVRVTDFQSVLDSGEFEVGDITCLVGKNEAGKTAILQALYRLNPIVESDGRYSVSDDYPRSKVEDYRLEVEAGKRKHAPVVNAVFELSPEDRQAVAAVIGDAALQSPYLTLSKAYDNTTHYSLEIDVTAALRYLATHLPAASDEPLPAWNDVSDGIEALTRVEQTEAVKRTAALLHDVKESNGFSSYVYARILSPLVPKFLYFDEYYQMTGPVNVEALKQRVTEEKLRPSDHPLLGLINRARLNLDELLNPTRTRDLKNRLEGAGNHLTKQVISYWSQNHHLQLRFDVRPARPEDPEDMRSGTNLWGEVYDSKHMVTTELATRSRGFVWFFSFLAWYGGVQRRGERVILLLDEPGLSLHANAQRDLLRYFENEVKGNHQVLYTTHSPFMVDPAHFERARIVQDLSIEGDGEIPPGKEGTKVLNDVVDATSDSLFPLQGALGYEIYQRLFMGPNSLVVEGVSDLLYLQTMSSLLEEQGRTGLSRAWTITPVGGSNNVPTFVALMGARKALNIAVLIDYQKRDRETIENLYKKTFLTREKVVTFAEFTGGSEADIEDLFEVSFYLHLVNYEFRSDLVETVVESGLDGAPRIVRRLEKYFAARPLRSGREFSHYRPARYFAENAGRLKPMLSRVTLDRAEEMFKRVNALL
jgi:predicted ATP-dependent endonuclease of OLD family